MKKDTCKHCGKEIGLWHEEYPEHQVWMHAPDDGPDAYEDCGTVAEPACGVHKTASQEREYDLSAS